MRAFPVFVCLFLLLACKKTESMNRNTDTNDTTQNVDQEKGKLSYLALGDSYTIGESVETALNFPNQLVAQLNAKGLAVAAPRIIARTGWTTSELISAIGTSGPTGKFNFVTLLIGVNNQYRGESLETYRKEFKQLLQTAIDYADGNKSYVFVISIPDWGVTSFAKGSGRDPGTITAEIDAFNAVNKQETQALGVSYIDITPGSHLAANDTGLIASDGLHPSGKMYKDWAVAVSSDVVKAFK
jgi:lysophospholipase L1-like esterase